jgi:hypothetical protein
VRWVVAGVAVLVLATAAGVWWWRQRPDVMAESVIPGEIYPARVEVLNASGSDGLARATTGLLRSRGIDVVYFGTASVDTLSTTQIIVRRGDTTAAVRVREALGVGTLVEEEDPRLLLDVTVRLGRDAVRREGLRP